MLRFDTSWLQQSIGSVWREKLLLHKLNTGISPTFICWICSFLIDCRVGVQLFNVFSSSHCFTQGLPQRSVLAPLLFLFYINDLASTLNDDALIALFADDVPILTAARKREDPEATAQVNLCCDLEPGMEIKLERWEKWVMPLLYLVKHRFWNPAIFIGNQKVRINTTPRLLGVILDWSLPSDT